MRAEGVVRLDGFCHPIRPRRLHPPIDVLAEIAVRPAIEAAVLYRGQVVRHQIGADLVTLVDDGPQLAAVRFPLQPGRVAQAAGEDTAGARGGVHFQHGGAPVLYGQAVFGDVAVGADADIQLLPSGLASRALVQWWLMVSGRSASSLPASLMRVSPG